MAGTRILGDDLETTEGGLHLHDKLVKTKKEVVAIAAGATVGSFTLLMSALTHTIVLILPNWTNAVTATISIENSDGDEIYSNSGLAENQTHVIVVEKPLVGLNTVKITLSGVPGGAGGDTETTLYLVGG